MKSHFIKFNKTMSTPSLPNIHQSVSLYGAKMAKKQSEEELHKIQNRIHLLKTEQLKLAKKIEQTDQKAYELYLIKQAQTEKVYIHARPRNSRSCVKSRNSHLPSPIRSTRNKRKRFIASKKRRSVGAFWMLKPSGTTIRIRSTTPRVN